ncbi:MAG: sulfatase [Pirellulaceae bacterium]|nr:sulfatase [Pirellulaceae bacterium]
MKTHVLPRLALAAFVVLGLASGLARAADRPNVLFIAVDDLNDWIGPLGGHPQSTTPNISRLCERGMLFTRAYCAAPACNPSRAALMTGIRPSTSGVYHNPDPWRQALPKAVTLPQHFMQHGYTALGSGKIYHGSFPDPASWDTYFPSKTRQTPGDPMPANRPLNGIPQTAHFDWGPVEADDAQMGDAQVADWVIEQLGRSHDKPFFLACGMFRPHLPWYVPQKYFDQFPLDEIQLPKVLEDDLADVPPAGVKIARPDGDHAKVLRHQQWKRAVQGYLASIAFMDGQIGRVLDALDRGPHKDNTIVVFWTDHGWHLGEKQHWRKFALWEEATRTPLAIVAPGVKPGTRCDRPVNLLDIYPTLLELCGLPARQELEGVSLAALLSDPQRSWERPSLTTHGRGNHALRSERYRYIRYADGSEELYDHDADPLEWKNLAGDPRLANIKRQLAEWLPKEDAPETKRADEAGAGRRRNRGLSPEENQ